MGIPNPGSEEWEDMVDFMRKDLECNMGYTTLIETARKNIEAEGKDFNEEYKKWKERKQLCQNKKLFKDNRNLSNG